MSGWIQRFFRGHSSKANAVNPSGDAAVNLAAHTEVNLEPKFVIDDPAVLPVWFDFPAHHTRPATYDGVFWEIEPWGEYLYYLAGAFQKNHKGLLRFGTAPLEIRAERNFETEVISIGLQDADRVQAQARSGEPWRGMTVGDACHLLLPAKRSLGSESWIGAFKNSSSDILVGRSHLSLGLRSEKGEPYVDIIYQRHYPSATDDQEPFLFEVKTHCRLPDVLVDDIIKLHNEVTANYRELPPTRVSGAIKM
ncbi:hypothetical protein QA648_24445 (plasmid) [Rhizobium sp. CB3171]|uniref:hypothetical protein n=1 Tax=Rhizobium sp. CB3171 TaxID=3039157 RepID=UPI0024B1A30F|nr:hypothetical protein [Rhizobium sp. CB3171]WFU06268.1 hypothetical protein QA648_24445 [Rhizobium sp. CB3171]